MIRVLALAPSGEDFFTRDGSGRIWHHDRLTGLDPVEVGPRNVERALTDHGYLRVERDVKGWEEVDRVVLDHLPRVPDVDLKVNATIARAMIPVLDKWLVSARERPFVVRLVNRLLEARDVAIDDELKHELLSRSSQAVFGAAVASRGRAQDQGVTSRRDRMLEYFSPAA